MSGRRAATAQPANSPSLPSGPGITTVPDAAFRWDAFLRRAGERAGRAWAPWACPRLGGLLRPVVWGKRLSGGTALLVGVGRGTGPPRAEAGATRRAGPVSLRCGRGHQHLAEPAGTGRKRSPGFRRPTPAHGARVTSCHPRARCQPPVLSRCSCVSQTPHK